MKRQRGIVLATLLIFLLIFTLLALEGLQTSWLEWAMTGNWKNEHLLLARAEYSLGLSEATIGSPVSQHCTRRPSTLVEKQNFRVQQWKSTQTCVNTLQDHYTIEFLGTDPCAAEYGIDYYRLTLRVEEPEAMNVIYLQTTYAKPSSPAKVCLEARNPSAVLGRLSWRIL